MDKNRKKRLFKFVRDLHGKLPDATTFLWAHRNPKLNSWRKVDGIIRPRFLLDLIDSGCYQAVGKLKNLIDCSKHIDICPKNGIPADTLVRMFALHWACIEINECFGWAYRNKSKVKWKGRDFLYKNVKRGGCKSVRSKGFPKHHG